MLDYIGQTIKNYKVLEKTNEKDKSQHFLYKCSCIFCGTNELKSIRILKMQKGTRCSHFDKFGFPNFPYTYTIDENLSKIFYRMKNRCYNQKSKDYKWYGEKGITVCKEWLYNPIKFSIWALNNGYKKGLTIDRIDPNGNYEPNNCQWITCEENSRKAGKVNWITINGETLTGRQWANKIGKSINFVNYNIRMLGKEKTIEKIKKYL